MKKIRKYNYIEEKDNKNTFVGISVVLLFIDIVLIIEKTYLALLAVLVVDAIIILCYIFANKQKNNFLKRKEKIIKNGLKISGTIVGVELINQREDTKGRIRYDRCLNIEYNYNNQKMTFQTPAISFSKDDLVSNDVDVYIFESEIYVDNFKLN